MNLTSREKYVFYLRHHLWILLAMPVLLAMPLIAGSSTIYVTNQAGNSISVIDPVTNKVVHEMKGIEAPETVRFSPDGRRVYYLAESESFLTVVDAKTEKVIKKVPL